MLKVKLIKSSAFLASVLILLTVLSFSSANLSGFSSRKPADRETIAQKRISSKRTVSFQHGRQCFVWAEFISNTNLQTLQFSVARKQTLDLLPYDCKLLTPQLSEVIKLHAPRSADLIVLA